MLPCAVGAKAKANYQLPSGAGGVRVHCLAQHSWEPASVSSQQMSVVWQTQAQVPGGQASGAGVRQMEKEPNSHASGNLLIVMQLSHVWGRRCSGRPVRGARQLQWHVQMDAVEQQ